MNLIQHFLLKISEESNEISTALLNDEGFCVNGNALTNNTEINLEINDLNAVIEKFKTEFHINLYFFHTILHERFKVEHKNESLFFWLKYTLNASHAVSKIASKCMQFGLNEKQTDLTQNNSSRLEVALNDLYFGIDCLNEFWGLGYSVNEEHIAKKIAKLDYYREYSIKLKCVSTDPIEDEHTPLLIVCHEPFLIQDIKQPNENSKAVIELPMKNFTD